MQHGSRNNPLEDWGGLEGQQPPDMPRKYAAGLQSRWTTHHDAAWVQLTELTWRWRWRSDILDLDPRFRTAAEQATELAPVPVNRDAALGAGMYMRILLYVNGATDLPLIGGLQVNAFECGNDQRPRHNSGANESPLFMLSQPYDVTDTIREGGLSTTLDGLRYRGASCVYFAPPAEGLQYWQVWLEFNYANTVPVDPNTFGLCLQASAY